MQDIVLFRPKNISDDNKWITQVSEDIKVVAGIIGINMNTLSADELNEWLDITTSTGSYKVHGSSSLIKGSTKKNIAEYKIFIRIFDESGKKLLHTYFTKKPRFYTIDKYVSMYEQAFLAANILGDNYEPSTRGIPEPDQNKSFSDNSRTSSFDAW